MEGEQAFYLWGKRWNESRLLTSGVKDGMRAGFLSLG
jgi:hypothetical protein